MSTKTVTKFRLGEMRFSPSIKIHKGYTVFLLINAPGRDAKHNEGASILTLKQQNTLT